MPWLVAIGMLIVWELVCRIFRIRAFILPGFIDDREIARRHLNLGAEEVNNDARS